MANVEFGVRVEGVERPTIRAEASERVAKPEASVETRILIVSCRSLDDVLWLN
jgi:hypothetical protein